MLFPILFFGWEFNNILISEWLNTIDPRKSTVTIEQNLLGEGIHSLSSFFPAFFTNIPSSVDSPISRVITNLSSEKISILLNLSRGFLIMLTLLFLKTLPFKKAKSNLHVIWELSYILLIVALIFPHQQKYAFFFMMPASSYILYFLISKKNKEKMLGQQLCAAHCWPGSL